MQTRRHGRWELLCAALAMACGGTMVTPPISVAPAKVAGPVRPNWGSSAWARERPVFTAAELAYVWERFDIGVQVARDHATPPTAPPAIAVATLERLDGSTNLGAVHFEQEHGQVLITASVSGLPPGEHAFTIHDAGSCAALVKHPTGHWNPTHSKHGPIESPSRHVGDFGNLIAGADGRASLAVATDSFQLGGDESVVGKMVVIHARRDDGKSQPSGNSGPAVACGVVRQSGVHVATGD